MQDEHEDLFDREEEIQGDVSPEEPLPDDGTASDIDGGNEGEEIPNDPVSGKQKGAFLDSQLAKILFDSLEINPDDCDDEEELVAELNIRLTDMLTIQSRLLAALDIKETDKNKYELLSTRVTELTEFLEQFDEDGDGHVDAADVKEAVLNGDVEETVGEGITGEDKTIDESLDDLEANDKKLQLSLHQMQRKNMEYGNVIKGLVAKNRQLELDNMLQAGEINKATHHKAVKRFVLKLSLNDGFEDFMDGAKMNNRNTGHSKTLPQHPSKTVDATASWAKIAKKISAPYKRT